MSGSSRYYEARIDKPTMAADAQAEEQSCTCQAEQWLYATPV